MGLPLRAFLTGVAFLLGRCFAAQALPLDDVMANAYRCGGIADSRQWLDCYYGAAQLVRAALGMSPVTENQARLSASPPTAGTPQDMKIRGEVMAGAARCYVSNNDRVWLDCYYSSAQPLRSVLGLAPFQRTTLPGAVSNGEVAAVPALTPPSRVASRITSYSFDWDGMFTVTLANGQIWRQLQGDTEFAHWKKKPEAYLVTITKGALGSSNMRVQGAPGSFKVERTK